MNETQLRDSSAVHVIDDDDGFRRALLRLLQAAGLRTSGYRCAGEFLMHTASTPSGCILLDLGLPGPSGFDLLRSMVDRPSCPPVIIVTARDDVATSVQAMKYGAINYIVKPICAGRLLPIVRHALHLDSEERIRQLQRAALRSRFDTLTEDERTIFLGTLCSRLNKQLAAELGSCERTVKMRRARMMRKVGLRSVPDLVRAARLLEIPAELCAPRE